MITEFRIPQNSSYPLGITTDSMGNVWFAEAMAHNLVEFTPSNDSFQAFPIPTNINLTMIWFLHFDSKGYLWFADANQPLLWRFSPDHSFANYSTGDPSTQLNSIAYDSTNQRIWFASTYNDIIGIFQIDSNENAKLIGQYPVFSGGVNLAGPSGITLTSNGDVFVCETFAGKITEFDPSTTKFVNTWTLPADTQPVGITVDESLHLIWFTDHGASLVGFVNETSGKVTEFATSLYYFGSAYGATTISLPYWIQESPSGYIWFNEHYGNRIARIDEKNWQLDEFVVPTNSSEPLRFALDKNSNLIWFTEFAGNKLGVFPQNASLGNEEVSSKKVDLQSGTISLLVSIAPSEFNASSVSGSLQRDGYLNSNLSITYKSNNDSSVLVTLGKAGETRSGSYTLTFCPLNADSEGVKKCSFVFLMVTQQTYVVYLVALVVIFVTLAVSLYFIKRWRF